MMYFQRIILGGRGAIQVIWSEFVMRIFYMFYVYYWQSPRLVVLEALKTQ